MDIFATIEKKTKTNVDNKKQDVQKQGEFYLGFEGFKITNPVVKPCSEEINNKYIYREQFVEAKKGAFVKANTMRLYKVLQQPRITIYNAMDIDKIRRKEEKREKEIQNLIKKGVDPSLFTNDMYHAIINNLRAEDVEILYKAGFDRLWSNIQKSPRYLEMIEQEIYFCIYDINSKVIMETIPEDMLENLINARKDSFWVSQEVAQHLVYKACTWENDQALKNLDVLVKCGRVSLENEQIVKLSNYFSNPNTKAYLAPTLKKLCDYVNSLPEKDVYAKYSTQRKIAEAHKQKPKKDEIKNQIDKLFEEAQKSAN